MCSCEEPSAFNAYLRTARKQHKCCECSREIAPGEPYEYIGGVWSGKGANFATCVECAEIRIEMQHDRFRDDDCLPCFGDLKWSYAENVRESNRRVEV